jgi:4-nitrophenyl phosphatase
MVGDRLNTDILGANQLGIDTAAVLTGVDSLDDIQRSNIKPNFIFDDIIALRLALKEVYQP